MSSAIDFTTSPQTADELATGFKDAMRKLAATVTLVTTAEDGARHGMPATAVTSLSMDPPSVLVCINRSASMHGPTTRSRYFCVNLLAAAQAGLLKEFGSRPSSERFVAGDWQEGPYRLPYLADAAAALFCAVEDEMHYGTHTVFVGRIVGVAADGTADPLVYLAGQSGRFAPG